MTPLNGHQIRKLTGIGAAGMAAALTAALGTGTATAAAPITFKYNIEGVAHVVKMNTDIPINAIYTVNMDVATGKFTGEFKQKAPEHVKYKAFGQFDTDLDVEFPQEGETAGEIKDGKVDMTLPLQIKLTNVVAMGFPLGVGDNCVLKEPTTIPMASTSPFNPNQGGELAGSFTLPEFADSCGPSTFVINMNAPGPDNTSNVKLTRIP